MYTIHYYNTMHCKEQNKNILMNDTFHTAPYSCILNDGRGSHPQLDSVCTLPKFVNGLLA